MLLCATPAASQTDPHRTVDPTFLHRFVPDVKPVQVPISSPTAHYKALVRGRATRTPSCSAR